MFPAPSLQEIVRPNFKIQNILHALCEKNNGGWGSLKAFVFFKFHISLANAGARPEPDVRPILVDSGLIRGRSGGDSQAIQGRFQISGLVPGRFRANSRSFQGRFGTDSKLVRD